MEPCDERSESLGSTPPTTTGEGPTESLSSRRRTHGRIGFHVRSSVCGFEGAIYSVATSMSTRLPLETDRRDCVPFRHDLLGGLIHEHHAGRGMMDQRLVSLKVVAYRSRLHGVVARA